MKRSIIKPVLPLLLTIALAISLGCSVGTALGKYVFSKDVASISLRVKPSAKLAKQKDAEAAAQNDKTGKSGQNGGNAKIGKLETVNLVMTVSGMNAELGAATTDYVQILLQAQDGYVLPETITLEVEGSGAKYTVYTNPAYSQLNPAGLSYNAANNSVTMQASLFTMSNSTIYLTGIAQRDFSN